MVRVKQRYFVIKIHNGSASITEKHILESLRSVQKEYYGEIRSALMTFTLKYYSPITQLIILRCLRDHVRWIGSLIPLICQIGKEKCFLQTIHLSGTIKQCQKFIIGYNQTLLLEKRESLGEEMYEKLIKSHDLLSLDA